MSSPPPGWNPDPTGRHEYRYWDGSSWTDDVSDQGVTAVDPLGGGAAGGEQTAPFEPTRQWGEGSGGAGPGPGAGYGGPGGYGEGPPPGYGPGGGAPPPGGGPPYGAGPYPPGRPSRSGPPKGLLIGLVALVAAVVVVGLVVLLTGDDDDGDTATDDDTVTTAEGGADDTSGDNDGGDGTSDDTAPDTTGDTDVFDLAVGDCLSDTVADGEMSEVPVVPCSEPHSSEIYYSHQIPGDELPEGAALDAIIEEECFREFESFIGMPYEESALFISTISPTNESWDAGDRELLCIVDDPDGNVTGSLRGANR